MKLSIFSFLFLGLLAFAACEKGDAINKKDKDYDKDYDKDEKDTDKDKCFDLVYPVSFTMPDGTIISGNEEVMTAIKVWYEAHPDSEEKYVLHYPVDIVYTDETTATIIDQEAMIEAKKGCEEKTKICAWDGSKVADVTIWEEHVVEPIVTDETCGCIVSGVVKHVKIGTDFAYVIYYGKGECDEWAYLVTYYENDEDDDKKDGKLEKCKFELDCDPDGN